MYSTLHIFNSVTLPYRPLESVTLTHSENIFSYNSAAEHTTYVLYVCMLKQFRLADHKDVRSLCNMWVPWWLLVSSHTGPSLPPVPPLCSSAASLLKANPAEEQNKTQLSFTSYIFFKAKSVVTFLKTNKSENYVKPISKLKSSLNCTHANI